MKSIILNKRNIVIAILIIPMIFMFIFENYCWLKSRAHEKHEYEGYVVTIGEKNLGTSLLNCDNSEHGILYLNLSIKTKTGVVLNQLLRCDFNSKLTNPDYMVEGDYIQKKENERYPRVIIRNESLRAKRNARAEEFREKIISNIKIKVNQ